MRVRVYWNLKRHMWSIVALEGEKKNRVILYATVVTLTKVEGRVSAAGREKVRRERRKNVHAAIVGELSFFRSGKPSKSIFGGEETEAIIYNPYIHETFVYAKDHKPFSTAPWATLVASETTDGTKAKVFVPRREEH